MRSVVDAEKIRAFMREIGSRCKAPAKVYLVGGSSAVLYKWRSSTYDLDLKIVPDNEILGLLPGIKRDLDLNVELAAPDEFIPVLPGWEGRSSWIAREGVVDFYHYDFYAQALAKVERGLSHDRDDVQRMVASGLVIPAEALKLFKSIEPALIRYPSINPDFFRRSVASAFKAG